MQSDSDSSDSVHMWSSLHTRKYCPIDSCRNIFYCVFRFFQWIGNNSFTENQSSSWSSQWFMCRSHHDMKSIIQWIFEQSCRNKSSYMRYISKCDSSYLICYLYKFFVIKLSRICRKSCKNHLWFVFMCKFAYFIEIYFSIYCLISHKVEYFRKECHRSTMRKMSSMTQIHT